MRNTRAFPNQVVCEGSVAIPLRKGFNAITSKNAHCRSLPRNSLPPDFLSVDDSCFCVTAQTGIAVY